LNISPTATLKAIDRQQISLPCLKVMISCEMFVKYMYFPAMVAHNGRDDETLVLLLSPVVVSLI
jgi:hypothetical protein